MEGTEGPYSLVDTCDRCGGAYFVFRIETTQAASLTTLTDPACLLSYTMRSDYCTQPIGFHERPSGSLLAK